MTSQLSSYGNWGRMSSVMCWHVRSDGIWKTELLWMAIKRSCFSKLLNLHLKKSYSEYAFFVCNKKNAESMDFELQMKTLLIYYWRTFIVLTDELDRLFRIISSR